jgi:hypothetical protein
MNAILGFKNLEGEERENCPCGEELSEHLAKFHERLMSCVSLSALQEPGEPEVRNIFLCCKGNSFRYDPVSRVTKFMNFLVIFRNLLQMW